MSIILVVVLVLILLGAVGAGPWWGYSRSWGYGPSGILGAILLILLVLALMGRI